MEREKYYERVVNGTEEEKRVAYNELQELFSSKSESLLNTKLKKPQRREKQNGEIV